MDRKDALDVTYMLIGEDHSALAVSHLRTKPRNNKLRQKYFEQLQKPVIHDIT